MTTSCIEMFIDFFVRSNYDETNLLFSIWSSVFIDFKLILCLNFSIFIEKVLFVDENERLRKFRKSFFFEFLLDFYFFFRVEVIVLEIWILKRHDLFCFRILDSKNFDLNFQFLTLRLVMFFLIKVSCKRKNKSSALIWILMKNFFQFSTWVFILLYHRFDCLIILIFNFASNLIVIERKKLMLSSWIIRSQFCKSKICSSKICFSKICSLKNSFEIIVTRLFDFSSDFSSLNVLMICFSRDFLMLRLNLIKMTNIEIVEF